MSYTKLHEPASSVKEYVRGYLFSVTTIYDRYFPAWTQNFLFLLLGDVYCAVMSNGDRHPGYPEMVVGPRSYPSRLEPSPCHNRSIVVELSPGAALRSAGGNPRLLTNRIADAKDVFPTISELKTSCAASDSEEEACAILDSYFEHHFRTTDVGLLGNKRRVLDLLDTTYDFRKLEQGLDALPLSIRHVRRLFAGITGMSPSLYLRIRRMEQILSDFHRDPDIDYLTRIYDFYDQPHFIREFRRFTGVRPRQFLRDMEDEKQRRVHYNLSLRFFDDGR
tara:strand:- start:398 stop:1231 length:834 start_codon:yes stop_codon:yes gene_type:complete